MDGETPRMSAHARERCREMGVSTKVAKAIVRRADLVTPARRGSGCLMLTWTGIPEYAVVLDPVGWVVVTVLFSTEQRYERAGASYVPVRSGGEEREPGRAPGAERPGRGKGSGSGEAGADAPAQGDVEVGRGGDVGEPVLGERAAGEDEPLSARESDGGAQVRQSAGVGGSVGSRAS